MTKNNKKYTFSFFAGNNIGKSNDAHYCDNLKRKQKPKKKGKSAKSTKIGFMKTDFSKKKEHLWKIKPL